MDKTACDPLQKVAAERPLFTLIGCPDWCHWSLRYATHEHCTDGVAELVIQDQGEGLFPLVLEVRHAAAPDAPERL